MASSAWSLAQILAGFALSTWLGFGASYFLLAGESRRYALAAAPAAGYAVLCLLAIMWSATFWVSANDAVLAAFGLLSAVSLAAVACAIRRLELFALWREAKLPALAAAAMLLVLFWPVVVQGIDLYIGTANSDFYQSLAYHEALVRFDMPALAPKPDVDSLNVFFGAFPNTLAARFGGVMFSLLDEKLFALAPRVALLTSLAVFVLALPFATYLFATAVMELARPAAFLAALLIALSGPVAMSFVHVLVGQNSALALLPLAIGVGFLALRTMQWRTLLFFFILLDSIFWIYVSILPYVLAPLGVYGIYLIAIRRWTFLRWALAAGIAVLGALAVAQWGMVPEIKQLAFEITHLFTRANRAVYVDFLTEMALLYSTGISSYPLISNVLFPRYGSWTAYLAAAAVFIAIALAVAALFLWSIARWARRASADSRVLVLGAVLIYLAVCVYFTLISLYGYALFKMASWLQFLFVPVMAFGLYDLWSRRGAQFGRWQRAAFATGAAVALVYAFGNVVSAVDFGVKSLGDDRERGAIVNTYGIGGNHDYAALKEALVRLGRPGDVVAIGMTDYIANRWTAYYVYQAGMRAALLSHDDFPDEDCNLPDIHTGMVTNTAGVRLVYEPRYAAANPDYYLLAGPGNLNQELIDDRPSLKPVWSSPTFVLVRPGDAKDILVTGRGFYRLEYFERDRFSWWWPERMRWTAEGGEFILLHASRPEIARRLSFIALAGTEREKPRHLEIWLNGVLIDETEIHGAAHIVSKPFHPTGGRDKVVVRVREHVDQVPRNYGLWNRQIALDQRYLNLVVSQVRLMRDDDPPQKIARNTLDSKGLIEESRRFDGISLDGWVGPNASFDLAVSPAVHTAALDLTIPGWAALEFPLRVRFKANGKVVERQFDRAGDHVVDIPFDAGAGRLVLEFDPGQVARVPGTGLAAFRLQSLTLR